MTVTVTRPSLLPQGRRYCRTSSASTTTIGDPRRSPVAVRAASQKPPAVAASLFAMVGPVVPSTNPDVAAIVGCVGVIGACRSLRTCDHDYLGDSTSILATSLSHRRLLSRQSSCRVTLRRTDHGKRRYSCINLLY
ncbi:hypothetical protein AAHA92_22479 [Salvia divinorum]|uniref:Uncharacterized protein n=1 Tax=Salvia divinorum TaxID=28513 RepID=A0ABD1GPZ3_SALDI